MKATRGVLLLGNHLIPMLTFDLSERQALMSVAAGLLVTEDGRPTGSPKEGVRFWAFGCARYEATMEVHEREIGRLEKEIARLTKANADLRQTNLSLEALVDREGRG